MSSGLLTFLKYIFLAALYLFFLRVLRAVWIELREPRAADPAAEPAPGPAPAPNPAAAWRAERADWGGRPDPVGRLVVTAPSNQKGVGFDLAAELTVGRAPGCGVSLPEDTFVSQLHARVFSRDGNWYVEDLGSTNGTYVNSRRISAAVPVRRGDTVQVGKTVLELAR